MFTVSKNSNRTVKAPLIGCVAVHSSSHITCCPGANVTNLTNNCLFSICSVVPVGRCSDIIQIFVRYFYATEGLELCLKSKPLVNSVLAFRMFVQLAERVVAFDKVLNNG